MVHDDLRVEWIRQRVCAGFQLQQSPCFEELLCRDDGRDEELIISFLNVVSQEDRPLCLLLFKTVTEEDVELKVSLSKLMSLLWTLLMSLYGAVPFSHFSHTYTSRNWRERLPSTSCRGDREPKCERYDISRTKSWPCKITQSSSMLRTTGLL